MKNLFSVKMYLQGLKKVRGAGIATAITVIVTNALVPIITLINELTRQYDIYDVAISRDKGAV